MSPKQNRLGIGEVFIVNKDGSRTKFGEVKDVELKLTPQPSEIREAIQYEIEKRMRSVFENMLSDNSELIGTCSITEESHEELTRFFDEITESKRKYDAMTPTERTLYVTEGKYNTIIVKDYKTKSLLEQKYGELNILIDNSTIMGIVFLNTGDD